MKFKDSSDYGIYYIGEQKGNPDGSLQCVSFVTYSVFYFYGVNVLRNWKLLCRTGSTMYKCVSFLYYVVSVEFIKSVPFLSNYYQKGTKCENINQ